jgi:hypothetical protein
MSPWRTSLGSRDMSGSGAPRIAFAPGIYRSVAAASRSIPLAEVPRRAFDVGFLDRRDRTVSNSTARLFIMAIMEETYRVSSSASLSVRFEI